MKIACVMMQKNETALLGPWVEYHAALCGMENLYVLDNGSTDQRTRELLSVFEQMGLNVNYEHVGRSSYARRESIVTDVFHQLGKTGKYDFIFPLDCDEFLATQLEDGSVSVEPEDIDQALEPFRNDPRTLTIAGGYDNVPMDEELFIPSPTQRKCFFASGQCKRLGLGYHVCSALNSDESVQTRIVYFHIHNRPYLHYKYAAFEKLAGRVPDFSHRALMEHSAEKREGYHLISGFMMAEADYPRRFNLKRAVRLPMLKERLARLEAPLRFLDSDVPDVRAVLKAVLGYSEVVQWKDDSLEIRGWALVHGSNLAEDFRVLVARTDLEPTELVRRDRKDVQDAHPGAPLNTGFALRIPETSLPRRLKAGETVSVHARDPQSNLFVPLFCRTFFGGYGDAA